MTGGLTLGAALLLGFAASGHCLAMCGGISAALGMATATRPDGRPRSSLLVAYQLGRMLSYAIAGGLVGGALGLVVGWLDIDAVRTGLRALSAVALGAAALVALGALRDPGSRLGRLVWPRLAPLGRRFLPVTSLPRAAGFGMVWGWMPCGFAYTVMVIAALEQDTLRSAATMLAFGLGTAPAMIAVAFGARRAAGFAAGNTGRRVAGAVLIGSAALTLFAPQIVAAAPWLHPWMPYLCRVAGE
ncbi:MAG TPA: sulfite exporter TauE/SafE family protein [Casimicrobiaceae bacterium]|nr:sulfite exporter TauE/SafE family protein [Casimicrobiaceae bacterium]